MADLSDSRIIPLASVRLFDKGQADPYVTDRGFGWYDVLSETWGYGASSRDASGEALVEYREGAGLVCRPFLVLQDTRETHYTTSGGTWEERRPATGSPRKYRLCQVDSSAGLQWRATSKFSLPENPHCAFSLVFFDTPADWDAAAYPPYLRIEFGGEWGIEVSKQHGTRLVRYDASTARWQPVLPLPEPVRSGYADLDERLFALRCLRGRIFVSTDGGRSYVS